MKSIETKTAALILNGRYLPSAITADYILCADGGYDLARKAGLRCDAVIGDMDSVSDLSPDVKQIRFDRVKDETDGQLAVSHLLDAGYKKINIYGALGGRPDQVAANINLLALIRESGNEAAIYDEGVEIYFVAEFLEIPCAKGDIISVLPYTGSITFEKSCGLLYPLDGLTIERLSSRGISNEAATDKVSIRVKEGKAFVYKITKRVNYKQG